MLDSIIKVNKNQKPQTFLEECKYKIKKNKIENRVNYDFNSSSSDESDNTSESEPDNDESKKYSKESDNESNSDSDNKVSD